LQLHYGLDSMQFEYR